jgi:hypothetical protein
LNRSKRGVSRSRSAWSLARAGKWMVSPFSRFRAKYSDLRNEMAHRCVQHSPTIPGVSKCLAHAAAPRSSARTSWRSR